MFCESCGNNIPDESRFCEYCGSEVIPEILIQSDEDTDNDTNYQKENEQHYEQEIEKEYEYTKTEMPKKSGFIKKAAILGALALVLIGGYSLLSQFIGQKDQPSYHVPESEVAENSLPKNKAPENKAPIYNEAVTINEDDFNWHFEEYYYEIPEGAVELSYMDILGEWKLMAVNYLPDTEEIHYSLAVISEYSPDEAHMGANTSVFFTHQYTKFDGEKFFYDEEDSTDMVLCSYGEGILQMALADDKVLDVTFWEKEGKQYGQSYLFRDDDNDGFADLVFSIAFVR